MAQRLGDREVFLQRDRAVHQKRTRTSRSLDTWMLSMKRMRCGEFCMMTELVRVPSPKNRTPRISVPSVTPVAAKMISRPGAKSWAR